MKSAPKHRGAINDPAQFARRFIDGRLAGFEKDMKICLTPVKSKTRAGVTHAYFPALAACCGTLEYFTALYRGNISGVGWQQVSDFAEHFLPQPGYGREVVRILFKGFRNPVAHRGIASGVWVDRNRGTGKQRRMTWKVLANAKHPACEVVAERNQLKMDPPWPCPYTHRVHIHLGGLRVDIRNTAILFRDKISIDQQLQANFYRCMKQLYPM